MSEPISPPGRQTTEFRLSVAVAIFGAVLSGLTVTLGALQEQFPDVGWIGLVAGAVTTISAVLGYNKSRAVVKSAEATAAAVMTSAARKLSGPPGPLP